MVAMGTDGGDINGKEKSPLRQFLNAVCKYTGKEHMKIEDHATTKSRQHFFRY